MTDLIWIGNALYPRWLVFAVLGLLIATMIGVAHALQVFVRRLLQRDGKKL